VVVLKQLSFSQSCKTQEKEGKEKIRKLSKGEYSRAVV
jgi:hypothetical protein